MQVIRCVGCRRAFIDQAAFDLHIIRKKDSSTWGANGACGGSKDLIKNGLVHLGHDIYHLVKK